MNEKLQIVFGLLGGLAIFLYGMVRIARNTRKAAADNTTADNSDNNTDNE